MVWAPPLKKSASPSISVSWNGVSGFRVWSLGLGVLSLAWGYSRFRIFGFQVSGFGCRISGFGYRVSGIGFRVFSWADTG